MAYTAPTPAEMKARYTAFAAVADETVQLWLTDAESFVDESWIEADYAPAIMALAAHNMAMEGLGATSGAAALPAGVTRFKSGAMDVTVSEKAASARASGGYQATRYGQAYARLLYKNHGGPRVVAAGTVPVGIPGGSILSGGG
jgi:hypothetical protein